MDKGSGNMEIPVEHDGQLEGNPTSHPSEFVDLKVSPSVDLKNAQFFRYRKSGYGRTGKLVEYIQIEHNDGKRIYLFDVVSKNQFVSRLGLKISEIRGIYDYNERNQVLNTALNGRAEPVLMRLVKSNGYWNCYAVVTEKFTEVKYSELYRIVENELNRMAINVVETSEFRTPRRVWKTYVFEKRAVNKVGEVIQAGLRVVNSIKGTSSICFYPYWLRLVCTNGMTSSKGIWKQATTHKGQKADIMESVHQTLKESIDEAFGIEKLIEQALQVKLSDTEAMRLLKFVAYRKNLSQRATRLIQQRLSVDKGNMWNFVNAITYVSSHNADKMGQPVILSLEQTAHGLLREKEDSIRRMIADADKLELAKMGGVETPSINAQEAGA
jgi:phage gpG-like protein